MCWKKTKKIEAASRSLVGQAAEAASDFSVKALGKAQDGLDWLAPRAERALAAAQQRAAETGARLRDDYVPRLERAWEGASAAATAEGPLSERASLAVKNARNALAGAPVVVVKKRSGWRTAGWVLLGVAAAGAAYVAWRRTQPVEDPWAEDYWAETTSSSDLRSRAGEALETVKEKVSDAADAVRAKVAEVTGAGDVEDLEFEAEELGEDKA
ncbi:MAG: hypothetical protein Q3999_06165 [Buchananella hordeovulneris]|nr:hypothetical protein [Buchananella hordeovulneris]